MALRSLGSLLRGTIRARTCSSSPGIAIRGRLGSAAHNSLVAQSNLVYHADARPSSPVAAAAAAVSSFTASRGLHSRAGNLTVQSVRARASYSSPGIVVQAASSTRSVMVKGARRFQTLRGLVAEHAHGGAPAALTVAALFSALAGILYVIHNHTDKSDGAARTKEEEEDTEEDPIMRTEAYRRFKQALKDMECATTSYDKALDQEGMKDDDDEEAMRARFEDWMKEYGRAYRDEEEKARRFRIFKATARFVDIFNDVAEELDSDVVMGLNDFSDWNDQEFAGLCGTRSMSDDEYLSMISVNESSDDKKATEQKLQKEESKD